MLRALNTSATGMAAQEANVNTIANNIANVNTTGFKKGRSEFEDLLYETVKEPGSRTNSENQNVVGIQIGSGAKLSGVNRVNTQGSAQITNNPFDLMINGEGYFGIIQPNNSIKFTRDGSFNVDAQGNLVTKAGQKIFPGLTLPSNALSVNISENGQVDVYLQGQVEPQNVGEIPIFTFTNHAGLKAEGGNLFAQTTSSGAPIQNIPGESNAGSIQQGSLESSNVNIMNEMTSLIQAQRAYEMNSKVMGIADQMLQTVNNIR